MQYHTFLNLKAYNTFGIEAIAHHAYEIHHSHELSDIRHILQAPHLLLGGGSNILLTKDVKIPVILMRTSGKEVTQEDANHIYYRVAAGEIWHEFVISMVNKGFGGIENLSLIPGTVGAAPIQNIGAYGVEVQEAISEIRYYDISADDFKTIKSEDCQFGYRDSIFKRALKGKAIITDVIFKLSKHPIIKTSYGIIQQELERIATIPYSIQDVSTAVINIRKSKLPDPSEIGNSGSFFKNPVIDATHFEQLRATHPDMPFFPHGADYKIPAAYLIEQCGWKGYNAGNHGVHHLQPLVLVNYSDATGLAILDLSERIIASVRDAFQICLEREVQIY